MSNDSILKLTTSVARFEQEGLDSQATKNKIFEQIGINESEAPKLVMNAIERTLSSGRVNLPELNQDQI